MNIQHFASKVLDDFVAQYAHKSSKDDKLGALVVDCLLQRAVELLRAEVLMIQNGTGYSAAFGAFEAECVRIIGDYVADGVAGI